MIGPTAPIYTVDLFPPLHGELLVLLRSLAPGDWTRPTLAGSWQVRDIVAHLLDVDLRRLSATRDAHQPAPSQPIGSHADLVRFLNVLNSEWVAAARRLSPRVLVELHEVTGPMVAEAVAALPPHGPATFPVSWAGESESENWFDVGRDYTERWHHQMQIRDAVGAPLLLGRRWLHPLLDLSFRALPHAYRDVPAPDGTSLTVHVAGEAGGSWSLVRLGDGWHLRLGAAPSAAVVVTLEPDGAWRMLYNALSVAQARAGASLEGDPELAEPLFAMRSVMV